MDGLRIDRPADGVVVLTLDRPERRNALDDVLLAGLPGAILGLANDSSVGVVVLTGAGGAFCAGADLECSGLDQPSPIDSQAYMNRTHETVMNLRSLRQPVIAAIEGPAVGAGLGLAAACDVRIAAPSARFIAPFLKLGLPPDFGCSYLLPRLVGPDAALDMFLSCRTVDGEEALRLGLVTRLAADPLAAALEMARIVAAHPAHAVAQTKRKVYAGLDLDMSTAIFDGEIPTVAVALHSDEFKQTFASWKRQITGG